jgi:glycerol-1-phosphate dehydrogenase [NAD(P)+]
MPQKEVEDALSHADETTFLKIGENILSDIPEIFRGEFQGKKGVIIADKNTYRVAGISIHKYLAEEGLEYNSPLVIDDPDLYANYDFVQKVKLFLEPLNAIAIAVGSGVINDLTKLASYELGRPYMCVATAASMDGYSSFGASITKHSAKNTIACSAPKAIVADLNVICKAPPVNNASGYADLYAKITAGADWILADALEVEFIDNESWHIVQDGLKAALKDPEGVKTGKTEAIAPLIEGLMLGGFAMQSLKSSRPASGAEHQFSHLWDMEHHTFNGEMAGIYGLYKNQDEQAPSHGFKVGIGLLTTTSLYERIIETPLEELDVERAVAQWKTLDEQKAEVNEMFEEEDLQNFAKSQISEKYTTKEDLKEQLFILKNNWYDIKEKLKRQIIPYKETKRKLGLAGGPVESEQIGITRSRLKESFYKAQMLRSRFTVLDLALRTGYLDKWVNELFGEEGALRAKVSNR